MKIIKTLIAVSLLQGCATYKYTHVDGDKKCTVKTSSFRDIDVATLSIDSDCALTGDAENMHSTVTIQQLIDLLSKVAE